MCTSIMFSCRLARFLNVPVVWPGMTGIRAAVMSYFSLFAQLVSTSSYNLATTFQRKLVNTYNPD